MQTIKLQQLFFSIHRCIRRSSFRLSFRALKLDRNFAASSTQDKMVDTGSSDGEVQAKPLNTFFAGLPTTIFEVISRLVQVLKNSMFSP